MAERQFLWTKLSALKNFSDAIVSERVKDWRDLKKIKTSEFLPLEMLYPSSVNIFIRRKYAANEIF